MATGVIDVAEAIALQGFERVEATPTTALLRVAAAVARTVAPNGPPRLVIDNGECIRRLAPLPAPPEEDGLIRVGYSAPVSLIDRGRTLFALELSGGVTVDLPPPRRRSLGPDLPPPGLAKPRQDELDPQTLGEQAERQSQNGGEPISELERRLEAAEALRTDIEARLAVVSAERATLKSQLAGEADSVAAIKRTLAEREAEIEDLRTRLQAADIALAEAEERASASEEARAGLQLRVEELEQASQQAEIELAALVAERDSAVERIEALDRDLVEARARIAELEDAALVHSECSAELETQLAAARAEATELASTAGALQVELDDARAAAADARGQADQNLDRASAAEARVSELEAQLQDLGGEHLALSDRVAQLVEELAGVEQARAHAEAAALQIQAERHEATESVAALEGWVDSLSHDLAAVRSELDEARSGALVEAKPDADGAIPAPADSADLEARALKDEAERRRAERRRSRERARQARRKRASASPSRARRASAASKASRRADRQAALVLSPPTAIAAGANTTARPLPARRRLDVRVKPPEAALGLTLMVLGVVVAILVLTGAVNLNFAP